MSLRRPLLTLVMGLPSACAAIEGISEIPCRPGCVDHETRLVCENGSPKAERCPASSEPCATATCSKGTCGFEPDVGAPCGPDGLAQCNEGYACIGPKTRLSAFHMHTCALADDGRVWCWGDNKFAPLGDGTTDNAGSPVWVRLPRKAIDVSAGYAHSCAVLDDGTAYCWGGVIGTRIGPKVDTAVMPVPAEVSAPGFHFTKISCGEDYTCALTTSSTVVCWGDTTTGQCGIDGQVTGRGQTTAVEIPGLDHVRSIETGRDHTCVLRTNTPTLMCWGSNVDRDTGGIDGKLGPAAEHLPYSVLPVPVDLGDAVLAMSVGYESSYALAGGILYAWGSNSAKQLGTGDDEPSNSTPKQVMRLSLLAPTALLKVGLIPHASGSGACARMLDLEYGTRYFCWGTDRHGELGFGTTTTAPYQYAQETSMLSTSAANMARGINHACVTVTDPAGTEIQCFGLYDMVANGTTGDHVSEQRKPAPVMWKRENAQEFLTR